MLVLYVMQLCSLYDQKLPISRTKMAEVTEAAIKSAKFYKHVVQSVEKFIQKVSQLYVPCIFTGWLLGCCRLGGRKGIRPVKTEWWGAGVVICLEQGADLHNGPADATATHCFLRQ